MNRIVIAILFLIASFAIAFSSTSDIQDIEVVVKIFKEVQEYVDTHEFGYYYTNDHHVEYIGKNIFEKNGISHVDFLVIVFGELGTGKPTSVYITFELNGEEYSKTFKIKNVKPKGGCEGDPGKCA